MKMSDENVIYCLENLAGYEPDDIDCDDVEIAVNDDQFATMSIVRTAELGAELARRLTEENTKLLEALSSVIESIKNSDDSIIANIDFLPFIKADLLVNQLKEQNNDK